MKSTINAALLSLSLGLSAAASAGYHQTVEVEVTNLTNATYFTQLLVATHDRDLRLFQVGTQASGALQAMAEGGDLTGLIGVISAAGGNYVEDPAGGTLAPGDSAAATLPVGHNSRHLSVTAMLLPTNDGFIGLNAEPIPRRPGVYTFYVNGYDAGTEANDEQITGGGTPGAAGIPADPGGNAGSNGTGIAGPDHNPTVHIHRGAVGDLDSTGGPSDLDAGAHRWLNPVAKVTVTVSRKDRY